MSARTERRLRGSGLPFTAIPVFPRRLFMLPLLLLDHTDPSITLNIGVLDF